MIDYLSGAVTIGYAIAGLCFLRFWRRTRDPLFGNFALAFALFAANQVLIQVLGSDGREVRYEYVLRVAGFGIILFGIARKNSSLRRH